MYRFSVLLAALAASALLVAANESTLAAGEQLADITGTGRLEAISLARQAERDLRAGRHREAAAGYRRALSVQRRVLGKSHLKVAVSLLGLAKAELALGNPSEALRAQEKALAIRRGKLAPDSWLIAAVHNDISRTLVALGRFEDAAKARRRDIAIHEKHLGPRHARLGALWLDYAKLLRQAGRIDAADRAEATGHEAYAMAPHGGPGVPPSPALPPEIKTVTAGDVTAHFGGEKQPDAPLRFGVQALWFSFRGDDAVYPFKPEGVSFWEWNLDIFSPDGKYVLLLQDRYGPYHVVRTSRLKDYLRGRAKADEIVGQMAKAVEAKSTEPMAVEAAAIHEDARWLSATSFRYVESCCGHRLIKTHSLQSMVGSNTVSDPMLAYRPNLQESLQTVSFGTDRVVELVRAYYEYSDRAHRNPGRWEKGKIQEGANPREYIPSSDELILAELGGRLAEMVDEKTWGWVAGEIKPAGISLNEIRFKEFTFRHVDVMGTGRFHYASAPRKVCLRSDGPPLSCE